MFNIDKKYNAPLMAMAATPLVAGILMLGLLAWKSINH
jgi:hypothetical protein